ncbi:hypothetical protein NOVOSPHI9U_420468 [Novosphingobium sp. 9U]|nr:hypothetical protein NOVOSPHI9U_420468 [Novosphingobium sp. 9U]
MRQAAPDLPEDPALLKAMVARLQAENTKLTTTLRAHDLVVQSRRVHIAKLRKQAFGKSFEKIEREIEQLKLALEDVLVTVAQQGLTTSVQNDPEAQAAAASPDTSSASRSSRRPRVLADTPRERHEIDPGSTCPDCGGDLRLVGEDVSEILEMRTAKLKVIEVARPKKSCRCCEKMVQAPAPSRPIPGSMAGGSLLAHVQVSKFDDLLPLYRQNEIFARMGADIPRSTLADWCGRSMRILQPVIDQIEASVLSSDILHADDTYAASGRIDFVHCSLALSHEPFCQAGNCGEHGSTLAAPTYVGRRETIYAGRISRGVRPHHSRRADRYCQSQVLEACEKRANKVQKPSRARSALLPKGLELIRAP